MVVLPFTNLSNDPAQDYFADGITENLTTELSRIHGSFVIARNTAFTYKDKQVDAREIGKDLGVRYVLEGSVQRDQNRVQVNAQLIDANIRRASLGRPLRGRHEAIERLHLQGARRPMRGLLRLTMAGLRQLRSVWARPLARSPRCGCDDL